jgi:hypothetical protein
MPDSRRSTTDPNNGIKLPFPNLPHALDITEKVKVARRLHKFWQQLTLPMLEAEANADESDCRVCAYSFALSRITDCFAELHMLLIILETAGKDVAGVPLRLAFINRIYEIEISEMRRCYYDLFRATFPTDADTHPTTEELLAP